MERWKQEIKAKTDSGELSDIFHAVSFAEKRCSGSVPMELIRFIVGLFEEKGEI